MIFVSETSKKPTVPCQLILSFLDSKGCQEVVKLEHLQDHQTSCKYNPNSEIICDKGCNLKISRRGYEVNNCITHLADRVSRYEEEIIKFSHELSNQKEDFERVINGLQEQNTKLNDELTRQQEQNTKLNEEVRRLKETIKKLNISRQHDEIPKVRYTNILSNRPPKWQNCRDMKIFIDQPNILEPYENSSYGLAQLYYHLEPLNSYFKVEILREIRASYAYLVIGLSSKGHLIGLPGRGKESIGYCSTGILYYLDNDIQDSNLPRSEPGDIIECGINFTPNGSCVVEVYFSINGQVITKTPAKMPRDGFYPAISLGPGGIVRLLNN